jgi:UDP-glucose 4-epimerase
VIARHFPDAPELFARRGWVLLTSISRIYDAGHAERRMSFRCRTGFADVLDALREGRELPFAHGPTFAG